MRSSVVPLSAEPKQGKHLRWGQDLGVVLAPKRPRAAETPRAGSFKPRHSGVFGGFGCGSEEASLEHELMQTSASPVRADGLTSGAQLTRILAMLISGFALLR
jgi:hypothetical protein